MEPTHSTLQRWEQKRVDDIKRIRGTLEAGELPLTETKKDIVLECAKELGVTEIAKLQEMLISIATQTAKATLY
jgi:hypothetical protein